MESEGKEPIVEDSSEESSNGMNREELNGISNEEGSDPRNIVELTANDFMNKEFKSS